MALDRLENRAQLSIAKELNKAEWATMRRICTSLNTQYSSPLFWAWGLQHLDVLDTIFVDTPEFFEYDFDIPQLMRTLHSKKHALARMSPNGLGAWQLAGIMGRSQQLDRVYGEDLKIISDEDGNDLADYLIVGGFKKEAIARILTNNSAFSVTDDPIYYHPEAACLSGQIDILDELCRRFQYDIKYVTKKGNRTLLHSAVEGGQREMVAWLIAKGVDPRIGDNLAVLAAEKGFWKIFDDLYPPNPESKPLVNPFDTVENQRRVAFAAIKSNMLEQALAYMKQFSIDPKHGREEERGFFHAAILSGDLELVEKAERIGWGKITDRHRDGRTIHHIAAENGLVTLIQQLDKLYSDEIPVITLDNDGNSILHSAAGHGDIKKFDQLSADFSPEEIARTNKWGLGVANFAAKRGKLNFVYVLYKRHGIEILKPISSYGNTILHHAASAAATLLLFWLMDDNKFLPNAVDKAGQTILHDLAYKACNYPGYWRHFEIIAKQVDFEILTDYPDQHNLTVQRIMQNAGKSELFEEIQRHWTETKAAIISNDGPSM